MYFTSRVFQLAVDFKAMGIALNDLEIAITIFCALKQRYELCIVFIDVADCD